MTWKIIWSPQSKDDYAELLKYVESNFGLDAALKLLDETDAVLDGIVIFPMMFPASEKRKNIRQAVITKHTKLIYRIEVEEIQLLHFWDTRQNPENFPEVI